MYLKCITQSAFYVNLYRAVIRPDIDLRRMLAGYVKQSDSKARNTVIMLKQ